MKSKPCIELRKLYWKGSQFDAKSKSVIRIRSRSFRSELQSIVHLVNSMQFVTSNLINYIIKVVHLVHILRVLTYDATVTINVCEMQNNK
uniref:Ovule protein n=1 Tax=Heterorhabditis bacteriophora TaxID=37862 RepID=A0A1I7WFP4_HETBA